MEDQIEKKHRVVMNTVADQLNKLFRGFGFCLLVFDKNTAEGRMNYVCNCDREDMLVAFKEFIANNEGRALPPTDTKH